MEYKVVVDAFEGPMDLLLKLIEKAEVDIYDIPINLITEQYLVYIYDMEELNLEVASEFLVMAATLLEIKSKMLLPKEVVVEEGFEVEIDPRDELVRRLLEYKMYKEAAERLRTSEDIEILAYYKPREDLQEYDIKDVSIETMDLDLLVKALFNILTNNKDKIIAISEIHREEYTLEYCIEEIEDRLLNSKSIKFSELLSKISSREEIVTYFLSLLELIRLGSIYIKQDELFSDIIIKKRMDEIYG